MPREPNPYLERGWYVSRPSGKYLKLCPAKDGRTEANRLLKIESGKLEVEREQMGGRKPSNLSVIELFTLFLQDVELSNDEDTFHDYQRWCTDFAKQNGGKLRRTGAVRNLSDRITSPFGGS
jgi:hypothetical protein